MVRVRVSLVSLVSGSSLVGVCRHLATVVPRYYGHDSCIRSTEARRSYGLYTRPSCPLS